ncbi:MAG: response regulator [Ancalomicrobiaceae bacterium]|nr:response regulator [Ancalomicrobiaceae bacterium]
MVHIVDDDAAIREALVRLCASDGLDAEAHSSAVELMSRLDALRPGCIVLDVRLENESGFDVQEQLLKIHKDIPVIFMTGYGTIPMTVRAMRAGAMEFLTKPIDPDVLLTAVRSALDVDAEALSSRADLVSLREQYETLTPREREVLTLVIGGLLNKQVAAELGTAEVTAKVHKRRVIEKLGARSVADLILIAERLGVSAARRR